MFHVYVVHAEHVVIGHVVVAHDHTRHQRLATEIIDNILCIWLWDVTIGPDSFNAVAFNHDRGVRLWFVHTINEICPPEEYTSHRKSSLRIITMSPQVT